ncbi:hypothetical protein MSAN_01636700 [Mycena sanguinolenta]|uniref:BTB domain-containing protein n=1 Tax=Mycena sanguinolenta TaxID=230812 RepID=A0A8H7CWN2_9AGAR|nr:hypothetical protein MSAN_01636700 [Mycena sanguinolenta]
MAATPTPRTSERFCAPDADLTISSSDSVLFKVHHKNLEFHSDIFANAANATRPENGDEIVHLEEPADVLDVLFQYMYRQPQPDLQLIDFSVFMGFAEAAEKYAVYSALTVMKIQMKEHITNHPLHVLDFAARHGHADLANEAARMTVGLRMSDAATILAPDTFKKWMTFHDDWHAEARAAVSDLIWHITAHNRETICPIFAQCARDPKLWYKNRSTLWSTSFLSIEFMSVD